MDKKDFGEHALDSLLDAESEADFGEPIIRDKFDPAASDLKSGNLRHWTAQDFASIYIRFKPHLERHARRYLSNSLQAEEVVQDAFLYLMTSLPELDTELGVLKFLKWKIRMLSLDILRSSSSRREISVPENLENIQQEDVVSLELERAEDNAVISLALARLAPRQREAIIASIYEEKSIELVAGQLGVTENAARQLLFRARTAFKKALVGEIELSGKSISQVLSIAAKKAAQEARDNALRIGVTISVMALAVGIGSSFLVSQETVVASSEVAVDENTQDPSLAREIDGQRTAEVEARPPISDYNEAEAIGDSGTQLPSVPPQTSAANLPAEKPTKQTSTSETNDLEFQSTEEFGPSRDSASSILATDSKNAGIYAESYAAFFGDLFTGTSIEVFAGTGVSAFLDFDPINREVTQILFQMRIDGEKYLAVAKNVFTQRLIDGENLSIVIISDGFYLLDEQDNVLSENVLANSSATVTLEVDAEGRPFAASLSFGS